MPNHDILMNLVSKTRKTFNMTTNSTDETSTTVDEANAKDTSDVGEGNDKASSNVVTDSQDSFWDNPVNMKIIDDILEKCRIANQVFQPIDLTPPSFSLGISQDEKLTDKIQLDNKQVEETEEVPEMNLAAEETEEVPEMSLADDKRVDEAPEQNQPDGKQLEQTPKPIQKQLVKLKFKNPTIYEKSPYVNRILDAKSVPTAKEMSLARYILENKDDPL